MYRVLCGGQIIHDDILPIKILNARVTLELGKTGLFEFDIWNNNPHYDSVVPIKPIIEVYREDEVIFRGRVLKIRYGFHNEKHVTCEGELAFLYDSYIEPNVYYGSFAGFLDSIISQHNASVEEDKQFQVGDVTVADFFPFEVDETEWKTTLDILNERMVDRSGGYLQTRHENGVRYIDLLAVESDISNVSLQKIELGKNLVDIEREIDGDNVFSAVIPLGAETDGNKLVIRSVNNGTPYVFNQNAVNEYGWIFRQVNFETITDATALKTRAENYLAENYAELSSVEIAAADLSPIGLALDTFRVGQWVNVISKFHFEENPNLFLVRKMSILLSDPSETRITIGRSKEGIVDIL